MVIIDEECWCPKCGTMYKTWEMFCYGCIVCNYSPPREDKDE